MRLAKEQFYEAFVEGGGVTREEFMKAAQSREAKEHGVDAALISNGALTEKQATQLVADWFGVKPFHEGQDQPEEEAIKLIPESFARSQSILPIAAKPEVVVVATTNPKDLALHALLEKYLRREIEFIYASERQIRANLFLFKKDPATAFEEIIQRGANVDPTQEEGESIIIELVDAFLDYAYQARASDVHIEPEDDYTVIRFRVDGILSDVADIPKRLHESVITRLKVLSKLATDEHRAAQDGRISYRSDFGENIDIRLSIVPTTNGEKAVMRLLSEKTRQFSLSDLGLDDENFKTFREAIKHPWGMILVTGPTGSGKTTTLYSALKVLNRREVNIATIEDPVEYDIEGVNQIQVNKKTNLTFAKGLRSIVRQDPDIIMVGEIRDGETADISVNAAMTGHLVLSTLHTNDAATTFPRLKDMGVEDFLISSTILVVIAQRLVRTICLNCIHSTKLSSKELKTVDKFPTLKKYLQEVTGKKSFKSLRVFRGKGCPVCAHTGYKGRTGIFEVMEVSDEIREAILEDKDADQIKKIAVKQGMKPIIYDGVEKIVTGITTLEEVLRVTQE